MKLIKFIVFVIGVSILTGCYKHGVGLGGTVTTPSSGSGDGGHVYASLPVLTWGGDLTGSTNQSQNVESLTPNAGTATVLPFNASGFKAAVSPFKIQDSGAVTRLSLETVHGQLTAGGGGTDYAVVIGPTPTLETSQASLHLLPNATAANTTNWTIRSSTGSFYTDIGANFASGIIRFFFNSSLYGTIWNPSGTNGAFALGNAVASTTNYALESDGSTYVNLNAPSSTALVEFSTAGSTIIEEMASGTQVGIPLGANLATTGHIRTPNGFAWMSRNNGNTADRQIALLTSDNLTLGDAAYGSTSLVAGVNIAGVAGGTVAWEAASDMYLDESALHIRNAAHTEYLTVTAAAAALIQFNATNTTSGAISWTAAATGAGNPITITGQAAGGTNNGGNVTIAGGAHAGAGTFDGTVSLGSSVGIDAFIGSWTGTTRTQTGTTLTVDTTTTDRIIYVDCTANAINLTLPTPTNGRMLTIVDKANNCGNAAGGKQLTLTRHAAERIDGTAANVTTSTSGFRFNIYSDGTDWYTQNGTKFQVLLLPFILFGRRKKRAANDTADQFKKAA